MTIREKIAKYFEHDQFFTPKELREHELILKKILSSRKSRIKRLIVKLNRGDFDEA